MRKFDMKDVLTQVVLILIGIISGVFFERVYDAFPYNSFSMLVISAGVLIAVFVVERIRFDAKLGQVLQDIADDIKNGKSGRTAIEPKDSRAPQKIRDVYEAAEELRNTLRRDNIIQQAVIDLENSFAVNIDLENLIDVLLPRLVEETDSSWGVFYSYNTITEKLELKKTLGLTKNVYKEFDVEIGEGLIGLAAKSHEISIKRDIPSDLIYENRTFLGKVMPKSIMTVPIYENDQLLAVIAMASIYDYSSEQISVIELLRNYIGFVISNCMSFERTQRLTKELQFQNELIQNMNDELEKKVSDRTDYLNSILNSIDGYAIISTDMDFDITTWNKGAEKIVGFMNEEVIGRNFLDFYPAEDAKRVKEDFQSALKDGKFSSFGWKKRKSKEEYFAESLIKPIYSQSDELQGYTVIIKDITDTKILEQALMHEKAYNEKVMENSGKALLFVDADGVIQNGNKEAQKILAPEGVAITGKCLWDFFVESDLVFKNIQTVFRTAGRAEGTRELLYKHDGIEWVNLNAIATGNDSETVGAVVYITRTGNGHIDL